MQSMWMGGRNGEWGIRDESELETLKLDSLPEGWVYQSRILTEDIVVPLVNGTAVVLQDSADNTYSKVDDFDPAVVCPAASAGAEEEEKDDDDDEVEDSTSASLVATPVFAMTSFIMIMVATVQWW